MASFADAFTKTPRNDTPYVPLPPGRDVTAYAAKALQDECDQIRAVPIGAGRNDQLNRSAFKMGTLIGAGAIDEHTVTEHLGAADGGLDYPATRQTIASGIRSGVQSPRTIPDRETPPWEHSFAGTDPLGSATYSDTTGGEPCSPDGASDADATPANTQTDITSTDGYKRAVGIEATRVRLSRDARRLIDTEDAVNSFRIPPHLATLTAELLLPDEPVTYRVDQLIPTGGNVVLAAQFKAGKTTLISNLARALVDGEPFLGRAIEPITGRVAVFNYEVDARQYRRWLRELDITNTDAISVLNLRGYRLPLTAPFIESWVVDWLKDADAQVWILDPYARAIVGSVTDENSNSEAGVFLDTLDVIKQRAGISELIIPTHTGRNEFEAGNEHARGATRIDDWADVRWILTKDKSGGRYFRASGRDVEVDETALAFDDATRRLTATGGNRYTVNRARYEEAVLTVLANRPGLGAVELRTGVGQILQGADNVKLIAAIQSLTELRKIHKRRNGHTIGHWLGSPPSNSGDDPLA